jgi:hypothetical protein
MILIVTAEQVPGPVEAAAWPAGVVAVESTRRQIAKLLEQPASPAARARRRRGSNQPSLKELTLDEYHCCEPK